jgi:ribosomal subunit interface protein
MKTNVKFKSIDHSQALVDYVDSRLAKFDKYMMKPLTVHVTFSEERHVCKVQVYIRGLKGSFRAQSTSDSFYASFDMCAKKIERQMEREKSRIKSHHVYVLTAESQLEELAEQEEREKESA